MRTAFDLLRVLRPSETVKRRGDVVRFASLWQSRRFAEAADLAISVADQEPRNPSFALLLARLHREGLVPLDHALRALRRVDEPRAKFALIDLLWLRCRTDEAANLAHDMIENANVRWMVRIAALLHDHGDVDGALDLVQRASRRSSFAMVPRGYVRMMADASRRGILRDGVSALALRIDDRLRSDMGATRTRLADCARSIAIVANGPLATPVGTQIDQHHCVVRLNRHGLSADVGRASKLAEASEGRDWLGEKIDIWFRPPERDHVHFSDPIPDHLVLTGPNLPARFANGVRLLEPYLNQSATVETVPNEVYCDLFERFQAVPSVGAIAIATVADVQGTLDPTQTFGFKPLSNTLNVSRLRDRVVVGRKPNRHDWLAEAAFLQEKVGQLTPNA